MYGNQGNGRQNNQGHGYNQPGYGYGNQQGYNQNDIYNSGATSPYGNNSFNPYGNYGPNDNKNQQRPQGFDGYADDGGDLGNMSLTKSSRIGFIRKVYAILCTQLLVTAAMVVAVFASESYLLWLRQNPWLLIVSLVLNIVCLYAIGCYKNIARSVPINYILLGIFTVTEGLLVSMICTQYDPSTVLIAALLTAAAAIGLTIYAFYAKTDFTVLGGVLFAAVMVLIVASIISIFIHNRWLQLAISILGVIIFSVYIVFDTQLILDKHQYSLSVDDYIWAALNLYIDIVQLFLYILEILGKK